MTAPFDFDLLPPEDSRWTGFLDGIRHDIYHLPAYVRVQAAAVGGQPAALLLRVHESSVLLPLVLRAIPGTEDQDASSPYGYPAPLFSGPVEPHLPQALLTALRELGLVSVFVRLHPLLPTPPDYDWPGMLVRHGETYAVRLDLPREQYLAGLSRDSRSRLRQALNLGFEIRVDDWSLLPDFYAAYLENMCRVNAAPHYSFGLKHLEALHSALPTQLHLISALTPAGELSGAVLFSACGDLMQHMYQGVPDRFTAQNPARLLILALRDWGAQRGLKTLHLGGGLGSAEDGIARFKRGMCQDHAPFYSLRLIPRPQRYAELSAGAPETTFFPAYRAAAGQGVSGGEESES